MENNIIITGDKPTRWRIFGKQITIMRPSFLADGTPVMVPFSSPDCDECYDWILEVTEQEFWEDLVSRNNAGISTGADMGWWDIGPDGEPQRKLKQFSIADMVANDKPLMAHVLVDCGIFPSVGQAKKNGWNKPLEMGRHELGPKKNRVVIEIIS